MKKIKREFLMELLVAVVMILAAIVMWSLVTEDKEEHLIEDSVTIIDGDTTAISGSRLMNIQDSLDYLEHSETEIN
jgi:hypothetical protein